MAKNYHNSMYTPSVTYEYPGKINTELFIKPKINTPALSDFAHIQQGMRSGEWLHLVQPLTRVLSKGTPDCTPTYTQSGTITDRQIVTGPFEINLEWCKKEFLAALSALNDAGLVEDGLDGYELGGRLRQVIFEEILEQLRIDIWKTILFSDNSLGAGSTNMYSNIDGVFVNYIDAAASYCVKRVSSSFPNAHNSTLAPDQARDALRSIWGNQPLLLKQIDASRKRLWVTGSVWENYYDSVVNNCCTEGSWRAGQDGISRLMYRGMELIPLWVADQALEFDDDNPFYDEMRHFIILGITENNVIGVERASDLNRLEMCYDCRTKTSLIQGDMRFGYNFVQCDLTIWAD